MSTSGAQPSSITTRPELVEYTTRFVQPPSRLYITRDDQLWTSVVSSGSTPTFTIGARILSPKSGVVFWRQTVVPELARNAAINTFPMLEGFLLTVQVQVAGLSRDEWAYAAVGLTRTPGGFGVQSGMLATGYLTFFDPLFWPEGTPVLPHDGNGLKRTYAEADPAAGAVFVFAVPTNTRWRPLALTVEAVTDGTAANRRFILEAEKGADVIAAAAADVVQTAGLTWRYTVGAFGAAGGDRNGRIDVPWPAGLELADGDALVARPANWQAGDDFGAPRLTVLEWFAP